MAGRNSKPDNTGPASHPSRLDTFGRKMADNDKKSKAAPCDAPDAK
ncbi:hypothetical protein [Paenibacillus piri]|nr:hypothetical protein [Paenibacillus piri]